MVSPTITEGGNSRYRVVPFQQPSGVQDEALRSPILNPHTPNKGIGFYGVSHNPKKMQENQVRMMLAQEQAVREQNFSRFTRPDIDFERKGGFLGAFWRSGKNLLKGGTVGFVKSTINGLFKDENGKFNPVKTLKSALIIGGLGALTIMGGPLVGLGLGVYFGGKSAYNFVKTGFQWGGNMINKNYEAAEKLAFTAGEHLTGTALSALGTMSALRAVRLAKNTEYINAVNELKTATIPSRVTELQQQIKTIRAANGIGPMVKAPKATMKESFTELKSIENWKNFKSNVAESVKASYQKGVDAAKAKAPAPQPNAAEAASKTASAEATAQQASGLGAQAQKVKEAMQNKARHLTDAVKNPNLKPGVTQVAKDAVADTWNFYKHGPNRPAVLIGGAMSLKDRPEDSINPWYGKNLSSGFYGDIDTPNGSMPLGGGVPYGAAGYAGGGYPQGYQQANQQTKANITSALTPAVGAGM